MYLAKSNYIITSNIIKYNMLTSNHVPVKLLASCLFKIIKKKEKYISACLVYLTPILSLLIIFNLILNSTLLRVHTD